jgi:Protein of unknown function (DUF3567)
MHMLYNSDSFTVVRIEVPPAEPPSTGPEPGGPAMPVASPRGGYEIVDKAARREIFIEGALAERFQRGVRELVEAGTANEEVFDDYIAGFTGLAQQPLVLH